MAARSFYRTHLGGALKDRIEQAADYAQSELDLMEEIAASRTLCLQALQLLQAAEELGEAVKPSVLAGARAQVQAALSHVRDLVLAAHRLREKSGTRVSVHNIDAIVEQLVCVIREELGTEHVALAERIASRISEETRLIDDTPVVRVEVRHGD